MAGGTVLQTADQAVYDWDFLPPCSGQDNGDPLAYILWRNESMSGRQPNAWAPPALRGESLNWTKWECKTASAYYDLVVSYKPRGGKRYAYTYVRAQFYFDANQVQAIENGGVDYIVLVFVDRKNRTMRAVVVPSARLLSTDQHKEPRLDVKKDGSATLLLLCESFAERPRSSVCDWCPHAGIIS